MFGFRLLEVFDFVWYGMGHIHGYNKYVNAKTKKYMLLQNNLAQT